MTRQFKRPASSERGFVIVAVLWILVALAALAMIFSVYLSNSAQALAVNDSALQTEAIVSSSLELAAFQLLARDRQRPSQGAFNYRLNKADIAVSYTSEAARINLNYAAKDVIANFFAALGASQDAATEYAARIAGWRMRISPPVDPNAAGNEEALYSAAGLSYAPRLAPFPHVDELYLVLGLPPALVDRALPFLTVYSDSSQVDVLSAAPEVIAALPGMTPSRLKNFLNDRAAMADASAIGEALGPAKSSALTGKSGAYRVTTTIRFDNGRRTASEVVIALGKKEDPFRVLSWQDEVETVRPRRPADL
jgi:general secretion pathway protein K